MCNLKAKQNVLGNEMCSIKIMYTYLLIQCLTF